MHVVQAKIVAGRASVIAHPMGTVGIAIPHVYTAALHSHTSIMAHLA